MPVIRNVSENVEEKFRQLSQKTFGKATGLNP